MREDEWLRSTDPAAMLLHVQDKMSARRLRLFACAVARANGHDAASISAVEECVEAGQPNHNFSDQDAVDRERFWGLTTSIRAANAAAHAYSGANTAALLREIVGNPFAAPQIVWHGGEPWLPARDAIDATPYSRWLCPWLTPTVLSLARAAYEERPGRGCRCWGVGTDGKPRPAFACPDCRGTGRLEDGNLDAVRLAILADALEEAGCVGEVCGDCVGTGRYDEVPPLFQAKEYIPLRTIICPWCRGDGRQPHPLLAHLRSAGPHVHGCWVVDLLLNLS